MPSRPFQVLYCAFPPVGGVPQATAITAVVMQETRGGMDGAILEIQRNNYAPYDRRLLVYVNGDLTDFREAAMVRQDFPGNQS